MKPVGDTDKGPKSALHVLCIEPGFDQSANLSADLLEKDKRHKTASNVPAEEAATAMVRKHQQSHSPAHGAWQHLQLQLPPLQPPGSTGSLLLYHRQHLHMKNRLLREIFK